MPGLGLETKGDISMQLSWELDLGFGFSGVDGFFFFVDDPDELLVDLNVTLPGTSIEGRLGFLQLTATDKDVYKQNNNNTKEDRYSSDGKSTHLQASFAIDLKNGGTPTDQRLGFTEIGDLYIDPKIKADATAELALSLGVNADILPSGMASAFPEVRSDFILDWRLEDASASDKYLSLRDPQFDFGKSLQEGLKLVEFHNVGLDMGSYLDQVLRPLVEKIQEYTAPIQPIIDLVTTPIPLISDLNGPSTLLDLAKQSGYVNPALIESLAQVAAVVKKLNSITLPEDGSMFLPIKDFPIFDATGLLNDPNHPLIDGSGMAGFDLGSADFNLGSYRDSFLLNPEGALKDLLASLPDSVANALGGMVNEGVNMLKGLVADGEQAKEKGGLFTILDDPGQIFGLLMGKPAVLVGYDLAPLKFEFEWYHFFPIYGPLGVSINVEFGANIDFAFGYDTQGIQDFIGSGGKNPAALLNGLFVSDHTSNLMYDGKGEDPAELQLTGGVGRQQN